MSGNATEEGILTQIKHPGHLDASRLAGLCGSLVAVLVAMLLVNRIGPAWGIMLGAILGLLVGGLVHRWITRRQIAREATRLQASRDRDEAETRARIAEMKASR